MLLILKVKSEGYQGSLKKIQNKNSFPVLFNFDNHTNICLERRGAVIGSAVCCLGNSFRKSSPHWWGLVFSPFRSVIHESYLFVKFVNCQRHFKGSIKDFSKLKFLKSFTKETVEADTKESRGCKNCTIVLGGFPAKICHKEFLFGHVRKKHRSIN